MRARRAYSAAAVRAASAATFLRSSCVRTAHRTAARRWTLSERGVIEVCTTVTNRPPGYEGSLPFGFGVVELPEGIRIISRIADPASARPGAPVRLIIEPLCYRQRRPRSRHVRVRCRARQPLSARHPALSTIAPSSEPSTQHQHPTPFARPQACLHRRCRHPSLRPLRRQERRRHGPGRRAHGVERSRQGTRRLSGRILRYGVQRRRRGTQGAHRPRSHRHADHERRGGLRQWRRSAGPRRERNRDRPLRLRPGVRHGEDAEGHHSFQLLRAVARARRPGGDAGVLRVARAAPHARFGRDSGASRAGVGEESQERRAQSARDVPQGVHGGRQSSRRRWCAIRCGCTCCAPRTKVRQRSC